MGQRGGHAVVLGASMGGLLAARVLAEFYDRVTVVERDILPLHPINRRGVPQGRLIHALAARGTQVLDELFPGFVDELTANGAGIWDDGDFSKVSISVGGHTTPRSGRAPNPPVVLFPSRPLLEWNVRRRVKSFPNITFLECHDLVGLITTPARDRVIGARVVDRVLERGKALPADLVVDATGRGSRTPAFLEELGYGRPREDELTVQLAYACQLLRLEPGAIRQHMIALFPEPGRPKMFGLIRNENNTWMFGVGAMAGLQPPGATAEMIEYAADFVPARVLDALRAAEPLGAVVHHRVPSNRWRRYDKMRRTPEGLLVVGDAICSFNPIYGQGMTVAAIEATVLRDCLSRGERGLPRRFFRSSAKTVRVAWQTAVGSDLALPEVHGRRPVSMRISNAFLERVLSAVEVDPVVAGQFMRVTAMVAPPARLFRPSILRRVARARGRRPTGVHPVDDGVEVNREEEKGSRMSNANIEATRKGYEAFTAGDLEAASDVFSDSAEWTINGDSMIGGTYRGKNELTELFMRLWEKATKVETKRYLADGDVVMVLTRVSVGDESADEADVFEFRNGKVVKAHSFGDTAMQERVFGSRRVATG
ncbi:nuclear transport factor 2 family protein [Mycobacterium terramassiliense]|uniref:2-polyprenyl-6-methoxyphenol hydroxylase and related FAD-dependent oxidoreductases n=1 Tax=Mycobacterium terramassiliense TaxID=1841859 RepID=A0A2U3N4V5_9MYCO|nr:nuclear transport factor 2 family protein [Mycobacterium terramassiliense]SPM26551.1 2-polyprenyl-6-methoxyphenol hydroxylase and related FAD-dependent oxidoreductases [Mycobacterium terramassiliense]